MAAENRAGCARAKKAGFGTSLSQEVQGKLKGLPQHIVRLVKNIKSSNLLI